MNTFEFRIVFTIKICIFIKSSMKNLVFLTFLMLSIVSFPSDISGQVITTIAGTGLWGKNGDGGLASAADCLPAALTFDISGNIYIADFGYSCIKKITPDGIIRKITGANEWYSGDGGPATDAGLGGAADVKIDGEGNIYICEGTGSRVRKINTSGIITTIAGTGSNGFNGDGVVAEYTRLNIPTDIALDKAGNLYIADTRNNRIRKINTDGTVSTFAGTGAAGYSGDGGAATSATLLRPYGIDFDDADNLYIADADNYRIRKIDVSGIITTVAGTGTEGYNGDNIPATLAQFRGIRDIVADKRGNIYVSDVSDHRVRKIDAAGIITTIAGTGTKGYSGDGGAATDAELNGPAGIAVNSAGDLLIADAGNRRLRMIRSTVSVPHVDNSAAPVILYPNPSSGSFTIKIPLAQPEQVHLTILNMIGQKVKEFTVNTNKEIRMSLDETSGVYFLIASTTTRKWNCKIVIVN